MDMPDPIDQTNPTTTPNLSNPQDLVDAALSSEPEKPVTTPVVEPVPPVQPVTPTPIETPEPIETVEQLKPLDQPIQEPVVPKVPEIPPMPTPVVNNIPTMGDDMPLAFAMPAPSSSPVEPLPTTTSTTPIAPVTAPATDSTSSYLPPVPPAPVMTPEQPKKKKKLGLVIGGVVALFVFVFGGIAGYQYLTTGEVPMIARVFPANYWKDKQAEDAPTGYKAQIVANQAQDQAMYVNNLLKDKHIDLSTQTADTINANVNLSSTEKQALLDAKTIQNATVQRLIDASSSVGSDDPGLVGSFGWCYTCGDNGRMATEDDFKDDKNEIAGMYPSTEASVNKNGQMWVMYSNADTANAAVAYNDANSNILEKVVVYAGGKANADGTLQTISLPTTEEIAAHPGETWVPGGVGGVGGWHWTMCTNGGGVNGVGCDVTTNTKTEKTTVTETAPTMACTGITTSPATTPVIGSTLTFTCAGTVTPSTAGTLSYKYRYSINGGATTAMTSNTLTVAACGTYTVECQACATLSGVLTCSPIWTGAGL